MSNSDEGSEAEYGKGIFDEIPENNAETINISRVGIVCEAESQKWTNFAMLEAKNCEKIQDHN